MAVNKKIWPAPAKINWFLHIVGKRKDGYHDLQTVFQFIDLMDEMTFKLSNDDQVTRAYDLGFSYEEDLCIRAAKQLKARTQHNVGVTIGLTKRIPIGGGLGGGSSNAATTLIALNHLWEIGLSRQKLAEIGLSLGADVPVFVKGEAAWAEGVGEKLTSMNLEEKWFLVVNPDIHVSTAQIFSHNHLTPRPEMMKIRALEQGIDSEFGENQLEPIVRAEYKEIDAIFEWLKEHGNPRLSGSGGAVFMPLCNQQLGAKLLLQKPLNSIGFVTKGLNRHPLYNIN